MKSRHLDYTLLIIAGILTGFGLIMISSASVGLSQEKYHESYYYLKNQLWRGLLPGLALASLAFFIPYKNWRPLAFFFLIASIGASLLVFIPGIGVKIGGSTRWIKIGSLIVQPSEFLKLSAIIYLAAWLSAKGKKVKDFSESLLPFMILMVIVAGLLIAQPDIGTLGVIGFTALAIYFLAGAMASHLALVSAGAVILFFAVTRFFSHASNRLKVFLHPELEPLGIGYQINQALMALGSGGIFGVGLGQGLQKFKYLPQPASDSIIAVIGEELGFIGLLCLLLFFIFFAARGLKIARGAPDDFGKLLAGGITCWIIIQALINIAAICGLAPLTGITLPFISLGGSSLVITLAATGILLNISKYSKL